MQRYCDTFEVAIQTVLILIDSQSIMQSLEEKAGDGGDLTRIAVRQRHIKSIKESLRIMPIISRNRTRIAETLIARDVDLSHQNESHSNENEVEWTAKFKSIDVFEEKYEMKEKIGEGSNGVVRRCLKKKNGQVYAVKSIMMDDEQIIELKHNFLAIKGLQHPAIIKYEALYLDMKKHLCYLVMEYILYPSLAQVQLACEEEMKQVMYLTLQAIAYLHSKSIAHRDIKMENILYDRVTRKLKIIDFGTCRKHTRRRSNFQMMTITGTLYYRAPEMFTGGGYNEKVDVWAAAILITKLVTGKTIFESEYHRKTICNILESQAVLSGELWEDSSHSLKSLLMRMLRKNPKERLSAVECLRDCWFYSVETNNEHPPHKGSFNEDSLRANEAYDEMRRALRSPLYNINFLETSQYVKSINGEEYHCIDSDDDTKFRGGRRNKHKLVKELTDFTL